MNKESRSNTVLIVVLVVAGCLVLLCGAIALFIFLFGISPLTLEVETPTETTTLSPAQLEQCREVMGIQENVEIEGEYYLYTPGFLDDSLECRVRARADTVEKIFDLSIIDPLDSGSQQLAPGRFVELTIRNPEPGIFIIDGFWFQT